MALRGFTGFETGDTYGLIASSGTFSIQSTIKRSGAYAARVNPTGSGVGSVLVAGLDTAGVGVNLSQSNAGITFAFRADTLPAATSEDFASLEYGGGTPKATLRLHSDGKVSIWDSLGLQIVTTTVSISAATWYIIEWGVTSSATTGALTLSVRDDTGTLIESISSVGVTRTDVATRLRLGKWVDRNSNSVDFYYDDIWIDTVATTFKGNFRVIKVAPNANGSTMTWTAGTNASDYQEVDETPEGSGTYVMSPTTGNPNVALFAFENPSATIGAADIIHGVKAVGIIREDSSVSSLTKIRIRSGGVDSDSVANNHTVTAIAQSLQLVTDPSTSVAWTLSGLDAIEAGAVEGAAVAVRLRALWLMIGYTPVVSSFNSAMMMHHIQIAGGLA